MTHELPMHERRRMRLRDWDYAADGAYYVTLCAANRVARFGEVVNGVVGLTDAGAIVVETWRWLASRYEHVALDEWCLMPNHLHGILIIRTLDVGIADRTVAFGQRRGGSRTAPTHAGLTGAAETGPQERDRPRKSVGRLIGAFKTVSTRRINEMRATPAVQVWQRDFWDRVVRDAADLHETRRYIRENPSRWHDDRLHPAHTPAKQI